MGNNPPNFPLISVITVSFNAAEFIENTIQSVLSQTYPNIEYILIDGASTDGTVEIIQKYVSRLAYWHSKPDRGLAHAFNLGLAKARGQWLVFLNADDFFWESSVVAKMVPHLIAHGDADVVFGQRIVTTRDNHPQPSPWREIGGHPWRWQEFRWHDTLPHPSAFTNRGYFDRIGNFSEAFRVVMDYELYLRGGRGLKAHFVPIAVSGMREGGLTRQNLVHALLEARRAIVKNRALPGWLTWVNFFRMVARFYLGQGLLKILGILPFAIHLPGRTPKASYALREKG